MKKPPNNRYQNAWVVGKNTRKGCQKRQPQQITYLHVYAMIYYDSREREATYKVGQQTPLDSLPLTTRENRQVTLF